MIEMIEKKALVKFEKRAKEDREASIAAGHYVAKDVDFVIITPAGGSLVVEREVDDEIKARYGAHYQAWKNGQEEPETGTPIRQWPVVSPAQVENLLACNVRTVEELASLSEQGVQRLGMGGQALRQRAKSWLEASENAGVLAEKIHTLEVENNRLNDLVKDLSETIERLNQEKPAGKPGRPKKGTE